MQPYSRNLGAEPDIQSEEALEAALAEMAWCKAQRKKAEGELDAAIQRLRDESHKCQVLDFKKGVQFSLADREAQLEAAIIEYAKANPEAAVSGKKKSRNYQHGTIGTRQSAAGITWAEGQSSKTVLERNQKSWGLTEKIQGWVKRLKLTLGKREVSAAKFINVNPTIALDRVKVSHESGELNDADLKALGMTHREASETVYVTPAEYQPDHPAD